MLRFQTAIASVLAPLLVLPVFVGPVFVGQGHVATLQDALGGTRRALEVLKGLEQRLREEPAAALGLILSATEAPTGDVDQSEQHLEALRNEVNLLQMELDALQSPVLGADGAVQSALGGGVPGASLTEPRTAPAAGITTGLDDSLRALLSEAPAARATRTEPSLARDGAPATQKDAPHDPDTAYSADPLRHGITCYRAGRYGEAYELLAPLDDATALYWKARTLERLERLDDAVDAMERALAKGSAAGEGGKNASFEQRRAETDLEFLRWKRDFLKNLPARAGKSAEEPR